MNKKGIESLQLAIADLLIIIIFFSACLYFIHSKAIEKKEIELLEISYMVSLFDNCEINSSINISNIKYENGFLILNNHKQKIFPKKKIEINEIIKVGNEDSNQ
jgi:hypothetical protein